MSGLVIVLVILGTLAVGCLLERYLPGSSLDKYLIGLFGGEPE